MATEPDYYRLLGIEATATQSAVEAAYRARSRRIRLARLRDPDRPLLGPSQEEIARAYKVLGDPAARAAYDATHHPAGEDLQRRAPVWLWVAVGVAVVAVAGALGARLRPTDARGPIAQFIATATATTRPPATPTFAMPADAPVPPAVPLPSATPPAAIANPQPATRRPPTATAIPAPTVSPGRAAIPVPPTSTMGFRPTDLIGVPLPVNLRAGPGTAAAILDVLPPGTLLEETGDSEVIQGFLWRRFRLADGREGWVRDIDVLSTP